MLLLLLLDLVRIALTFNPPRPTRHARYCPKRGCFWVLGRALRALGILLNTVVALACFGLFGLLLYFNIAAAFKSNFFIVALCLAACLWIIACSEVAVLSFFKFEVQHHVKSRLDRSETGET